MGYYFGHQCRPLSTAEKREYAFLLNGTMDRLVLICAPENCTMVIGEVDRNGRANRLMAWFPKDNQCPPEVWAEQ